MSVLQYEIIKFRANIGAQYEVVRVEILNVKGVPGRMLNINNLRADISDGANDE